MYAVFTMVLLQSSQLQTGHLIFYSDNGQIMRVIPATSGMAGYQCQKCQWKRGRGPIPQRRDGYEIDVSGRYRLATKGIEGMAYPLLPDPVVGPKNQVRSEIMLHRDVGMDGSAGCLVLHLTPSEYQKFNTWISEAAKKDHQRKVPLKVQYNPKTPIQLLIKLVTRGNK